METVTYSKLRNRITKGVYAPHNTVTYSYAHRKYKRHTAVKTVRKEIEMYVH